MAASIKPQQERIVHKKCGLKLRPPSLVLFYKDNKDVLRKRTMPIRNFPKSGSINFALHDLKTRHETYLSGINNSHLEKMLSILQQRLKGVEIDDALRKVNAEFSVNPDEDLNKLGDEDLRKKKKIMNETFEVNRKKPGDSDFKYDNQVDFPLDEVFASGWDSGEEIPELEF